MTVSSAETDHILIVDDHSIQCASAQASLTSAGYVVTVAESADAAVRVFSQTPARLVLIALDTQSTSTERTLQQLRALPHGPAAALIVVIDDAADEARALQLGADDSWAWPASRSELAWRVRSLLRVKAHGQAVAPSELWRVQRDELLAMQRQREETLTLLVHDMKNPLSGVISNAEFLSTSDGLDAEQLSSAQDIVQASRRLHRMVLSLLDVSLSDQGQLSPSFESLDIGELLTETRATCSGRLRDKGLELAIQALPVFPRVRGDRDMLLRLMANLVDNAIGASQAGAVIEVLTFIRPDAVELRFCDSGPTLPAADLARLLEELTHSGPAAPERRS
ncbi:MAG: response regulator, partial [Polyangiales bacterium]